MKYIEVIGFICLCLGFAGFAEGVETRKAKLLFYINFDNNSLVPEVAAGDRNGQINGHIEFAPGFKGSAAVFKNGNFLCFKAPGNFNRQAGTIEMRFKLLPVREGSCKRHLVTFYTDESERFYLRLIGRNNFHGFFRGSDGGTSLGCSFSDVPKGVWHHLAFCWKDKTGEKITHITIYLDGRKMIDKDANMILPEFKNGRIYLGSYSKGQLTLNGLLDEFKIYDDVVYTRESYPELFVYPPIAKLERYLSQIQKGIDVIPDADQKRKAQNVYEQLSEAVSKLKDGSIKGEGYFREYSRLEKELSTLWSTSAASAIWWKDRPAKPFDVLPISCMKKITTCWPDAPKKSQLPKLSAAGNEWSAFQLVILPRFEDVNKCIVRADNLRSANGIIASSNIKIFKVGTVRQKGDMRIWADPIYPLKWMFNVKA